MSRKDGPNSTRRRRYKDKLASRFGRRCTYCGKPFTDLRDATLDHIVPLSLWRSWSLTSLVLACVKCNRAKGDRVPLFMALILPTFLADGGHLGSDLRLSTPTEAPGVDVSPGAVNALACPPVDMVNAGVDAVNVHRSPVNTRPGTVNAAAPLVNTGPGSLNASASAVNAAVDAVNTPGAPVNARVDPPEVPPGAPAVHLDLLLLSQLAYALVNGAPSTPDRAGWKPGVRPRCTKPVHPARSPRLGPGRPTHTRLCTAPRTTACTSRKESA